MSDTTDCIWTENEDGWYETSCGEAHEFTTGDPKENQFAYCPYCGKPLKEKAQ